MSELALFLLLAVALFFASGATVARQVPPRRPPDTAAYLLMGCALLLVLIRRRWPVGAVVGTAALSAAFLIANYPYGPIVVTTFVSMYALAVRQSPRKVVAVTVLTLAILMTPQVRLGLSGDALAQGAGLLGAWTALLAIPALLGVTVRMVSDHRTDVRERQRQEERLKVERDRLTVSEERLELSREVHDVVAHNLAVISLQAGVALYKFEQRPAEARQALEAIRLTSNDALRDLRNILDALRSPAEAGVGSSLDQIGQLVERVTRGGLRVILEVRGDKPTLEALLETSAYRIVQESLSNVVRHAKANVADVNLMYAPDGLSIEVADDGRGCPHEKPGGHGIDGMRERACAHGGWLEAGPAVSGGFRVRAWLPYREGGAAR